MDIHRTWDSTIPGDIAKHALDESDKFTLHNNNGSLIQDYH